MDVIPLTIVKAARFSAYGSQLKQRFPWYPQELVNDWPHHASSLTLGESSIVKYGVSYPLRTGLDAPDGQDFQEVTKYLPVDEGQSGEVEELFQSRGVCVISRGPLGGPSNLKGLYRPLISYGTGVGVRCVTKATFSQNETESDGVPEDKTFVCLAEKSGISMYSETSSETHVSHLPEFNISEILPCRFGLLVVPSKIKNDPETDYHKGLFILTHPVKQVSKIWIRLRPGHDFSEYDNREEKLLWCEKDVCVFWSLSNDKILIRRLIQLDKDEILQLSTLNASMYVTNPEISIRHIHPGSSNIHTFQQFVRHPHTRSTAMRLNRDRPSASYWPSFDFSNSATASPGAHNIGQGFYPPHVLVCDDPELYFKPLYQIDLPKGRWKEPRKFQLQVTDEARPNRVGLWFLVKCNLYLHGFDVESGTKLAHYALKQVEDFTCPTGKDKIPLIIILHSNGNIRLGWLDSSYKIVCTSVIDVSSIFPNSVVQSVNNVLFGDTIVCALNTFVKDKCGGGDIPGTEKTIVESAAFHLRNYRKNGLVRKCIDTLMAEISSKTSIQILARFCGKGEVTSLSAEWSDLTTIIHAVFAEQPKGEQLQLGNLILKALDNLNEDLKITCFSANYKQKLKGLMTSLESVFPSPAGEQKAPTWKSPSHFATFGALMGLENPSCHPKFEKLPEVLQLILEQPDTVEKLEHLMKIQSDEEYYAPIIELLIADIYHRNSLKARFDFPKDVLHSVGRTDYLSGHGGHPSRNLIENKNGLEEAENIFVKKDDLIDELSWTTPILNLSIFSEDRRLEEVCRILDSSTPALINIDQRAEMSDHEFVEEQEKSLLQLVQINLSAPVGRAAFTLRSEEKSYSNLTSFIFIPDINFSGKCAIKGTNIDLNETDLTANHINWPHFHNATAAALAVRFTDSPADAWFAYNKSKTSDGPEQAGMVLGFGLNGILSSMPPTLRHDHLSKESSFTTMSMLLGLSANLAGTGDMSAWKLISLHIGAMLPACTTELEIPRLATLVAPCALGLLFLETHNTHIAKVLLGEISKRFTPLSVFGGGGGNNSTSVLNTTETAGAASDREAHSLCAGLGLGFVNLGKGRLNLGGHDEDDFDGVLRRFVVGGPKPTDFHGNDETELYNQFGQSLPSLWEEYRCCHIEEGDNVNVDVTTPSAIIAVALIYLRSGNEAVLNWLSPPTTLHLLDGVRPDLLMLRSLASILVFETVPCPSVTWLEDCLIPKSLLESALQQPDKQSRLDHESINQAWACIVCGYCLGLGIRFAGTSDLNVTSTLWHYTDLLLKLSSKESKLSEYFPKNFLESCVCNLLMSLSLVLAGTGDIPVLRLSRYLQAKVSSTHVTPSSNTYGLEMCISMSTGILFLGAGRYSLSNDDKSIAVLLASVFPKWPINSIDNRYHLQALRHLYILAAQPRLILPKPMPLRSKLYFSLEFIDGKVTRVAAPVLLPPFYLIKKVQMDHPEFLHIEFNLPKDLPYLKHIVDNSGILNLVPMPISSSKYSFLRKMAWKIDHVLHPTFAVDNLTPKEERVKLKPFHKISSLAEWSGMKQIVSPVLALTTGNPKDEDWIWQVKILYWWVGRSKSKNLPTCIPDDLLQHLRRKADPNCPLTKMRVRKTAVKVAVTKPYYN